MTLYTLEANALVIGIVAIVAFLIAMVALLILKLAKDYARSRRAIRQILSTIGKENPEYQGN